MEERDSGSSFTVMWGEQGCEQVSRVSSPDVMDVSLALFKGIDGVIYQARRSRSGETGLSTAPQRPAGEY